MLLSTSSSNKGELPPPALIGHPNTPRGEELQPLGSLVFAETMRDLSFHLREGERERERREEKRVKCKPEPLPWSHFEKQHHTSRLQAAAQQKKKNAEGVGTTQLKMLRLLLLLAFTEVRDDHCLLEHWFSLKHFNYKGQIWHHHCAVVAVFAVFDNACFYIFR